MKSNRETYDTNRLLQNMEKDFSEIETFNDMMNEFYLGEINLDNNIIDTADYITEDMAEELFEVLKNARMYPEDYNLTARLYTQETNKKIGNILENFGLELYQKYTISGSKDENDYDESPDFLDTTYISIYPEFSFIDIKKLVGFLKKIEIADQETKKNILLLINSLTYKIENGFSSIRERGDEELNIYKNIGNIDDEIQRLQLWEELGIEGNRDFFLALKDGYIDKFRECLLAGFYTKISSNDITQPMFFEDIINIETEEGERIIDTDNVQGLIREIDESIKSSRYVFDKIKDTKPLIQKVEQEFNAGISNIINIIKDSDRLKNEEKRQRIDQFNDYTQKIRHMNK